jgi:hypothetical protein
LTRKVPNPVGMSSGQTECWGVHWTHLEPLHQLPEPERVNFAVLPTDSGSKKYRLDLWYGHSAINGWIVVNWQDVRNKPGRSPRTLYMLRGLDDAEIRVRFSDWSPPEFREAKEYLKSCEASKQSVLNRDLASLESRIEGSEGSRC